MLSKQTVLVTSQPLSSAALPEDRRFVINTMDFHIILSAARPLHPYTIYV
jgi:hypothetical protein